MESLPIASYFELSSAVVRQVVSLVRSLSLLLSVCVEVVFPYSLFPVHFFAWFDIAGIQLEIKLGPAVFVVFGNHPCLLPVKPALPEDPRRDSVHCQLVVSFVRCSSTNGSSSPSGSSFEISSKEGVAVCVVAAFFVLVEVLVVGFSRVILRLAVGSWRSTSAVSSTRSRRGAAAGALTRFPL